MDPSPQFVPHRVAWTREKSARFWDAVSSHLSIDENYFSAMVGSSLVRAVRSEGVDLSGRVLDFGCGLGDLIGRLIEHGVRAEGADFSPSSVARVNQRFEGQPAFGGAHVIASIPTTLPSASFDTIFFIETIEHLLEDDLTATVAELRRLLRTGGTVIVTTPNEEKMGLNEVVCPDCGCIFHRVQHVRTWSPRGLTEFMARSGFERVATRTMYLQDRWWKSLLLARAARFLGKPLPHLIYIGRAI